MVTKEVTFPKEGSYNLKLIKVEQGNTTNKLQGATFRITSPNGTVTETTSSNGEINVGPITINTPGTDTITIEETPTTNEDALVIDVHTIGGKTREDSPRQEASTVEHPQVVTAAIGNNIRLREERPAVIRNGLVPSNR